MEIEEIKKKLQVWIESNRDFYNRYVRAIRKGRATLVAYMHIYDFAMSQIPNLPVSIKYGSYGNLFENYYGKFGFNKLLGMLAQVLDNDVFLYLQAQKNTQNLKYAILYWVLLDDFHFCLICKMKDCEKNLEEKLRDIELQIIQNSIILEIENEQYWLSPHIFKHLLFEEEEKESFKQMIMRVQKEQNDDGVTMQTTSTGLQSNEDPPKVAKPKGRKPSITSKSLREFISLRIQDAEKLDKTMQFVIIEELKLVDGPGLACMAIAMEFCEVIEELDGDKVTPFHVLLKKENAEICDSSNFSKPHRLLCCYLKDPQKVEETKRIKIDKYVEKLQEIMK